MCMCDSQCSSWSLNIELRAAVCELELPDQFSSPQIGSVLLIDPPSPITSWWVFCSTAKKPSSHPCGAFRSRWSTDRPLHSEHWPPHTWMFNMMWQTFANGSYSEPVLPSLIAVGQRNICAMWGSMSSATALKKASPLAWFRFRSLTSPNPDVIYSSWLTHGMMR